VNTEVVNQLVGLPVEQKEELMRSVIARYLKGEKVEEIAKEYGCSRWVMNQALVAHAETEWKDAQVARAITRLNDAEDLLDNAKDAFELAKGREILKSAQWMLEKLWRRLFGQEQQSNLQAINIHLGINRPEPSAVND
jgi:HD superfamily phosphohydrolase